MPTKIESQVHRYELTVVESHLDSFGHMNNAAYLKILEEARWELITSGGFGYEKIQQSKLGPTILEVNLRFRREIKLRQKIIIETRGLSYDSKVCELEQLIKSEKGDVMCVALFKVALFDTEQRKLVSPTQEWLDAIGVKIIAN